MGGADPNSIFSNGNPLPLLRYILKKKIKNEEFFPKRRSFRPFIPEIIQFKVLKNLTSNSNISETEGRKDLRF